MTDRTPVDYLNDLEKPRIDTREINRRESAGAEQLFVGESEGKYNNAIMNRLVSNWSELHRASLLPTESAAIAPFIGVDPKKEQIISVGNASLLLNPTSAKLEDTDHNLGSIYLGIDNKSYMGFNTSRMIKSGPRSFEPTLEHEVRFQAERKGYDLESSDHVRAFYVYTDERIKIVIHPEDEDKINQQQRDQLTTYFPTQELALESDARTFEEMVALEMSAKNLSQNVSALGRGATPTTDMDFYMYWFRKLHRANSSEARAVYQEASSYEFHGQPVLEKYNDLNNQATERLQKEKTLYHELVEQKPEGSVKDIEQRDARSIARVVELRATEEYMVLNTGIEKKLQSRYGETSEPMAGILSSIAEKIYGATETTPGANSWEQSRLLQSLQLTEQEAFVYKLVIKEGIAYTEDPAVMLMFDLTDTDLRDPINRNEYV